jgi:predicted small secreted protein
MKHLILLTLCATVLALTSCNTTIGIYRDTKAAAIWTKNKIKPNAGGDGGASYDDYGAPVY